MIGLWRRKAGLSVLLKCGSVSNEWVHAMTRMCGALVASVSVVALMLAANEAFARSGGGHSGGFASTRSVPRPAVAFQHHRRNHVGGLWPAAGGYYYEPSYGEPMADVTQPRDTHYTYTYDVPWDWAHRFPPAVAPSDRPYVSSCPTETVTLAGRGSADKTINVIRCY